jgi:hypothetical protein
VTKQFWTFLAIGLAAVGAGIGLLFVSTQGAHLDLKGEILKVRVMALNPQASLVIADFRVANPSNVRFVVRTVEMKLDPLSGEALDGQMFSKFDTENVFKYEKLLGPKYNDVLSIKDEIAPHQTVDRMVGARIELPETGIDLRRDIHLSIVDLDGTVVDLIEKRK